VLFLCPQGCVGCHDNAKLQALQNRKVCQYTPTTQARNALIPKDVSALQETVRGCTSATTVGARTRGRFAHIFSTASRSTCSPLQKAAAACIQLHGYTYNRHPLKHLTCHDTHLPEPFSFSSHVISHGTEQNTQALSVFMTHSHNILKLYCFNSLVLTFSVLAVVAGFMMSS
jgi:hypothetical protein